MAPDTRQCRQARPPAFRILAQVRQRVNPDYKQGQNAREQVRR